MTLLAVANDYFITNDIEYDPVHLFKDVSVSGPPILTITKVTSYFPAWAVSLGSLFFGLLFFFIQLDARESAEPSKTWLCPLVGWTKKNNGNRFVVSVQQEAIGMVHLKGYMYKWVMEDLGKKTHKSD